ncbi:PDR/VanB family oxidoreductase [uncultured Sneathiella sp.]|uniref:PDR/VanB family oxidoreductase n=1 Tax=uncultured Sneathiella sp. TaxID=879315 RepID=UPI0030ECE7F4|tara:strand:- start:4324 stop:5274 length:951 start_codon:yes stop_codon:yes gene_type:complete
MTMQDVFIYSITFESIDVIRVELRAADGNKLAAFTPGAHINLKLHDKVSRSYSLINDADERRRYVIAVQKDADGRGGSKWLHEVARVGQKLRCGEPINAFPLNENATHSVFIAGGIGITPVWSMIQKLEKLDKPWQLYYRARARQKAPFLNELRSLGKAGKVNISFSDETSRNVCDLDTIISNAPPEADLYCCGPTGMLHSFEKACAELDSARIHTEHFQADREATVQNGFIVRAVKSNMELQIKEGQTILQVLRDAGLDPPYSCESGLCGECQTRVISGHPDHHDLFLTDEDKSSGETIMICCSGSHSSILEIDL